MKNIVADQGTRYITSAKAAECLGVGGFDIEAMLEAGTLKSRREYDGALFVSKADVESLGGISPRELQICPVDRDRLAEMDWLLLDHPDGTSFFLVAKDSKGVTLPDAVPWHDNAVGASAELLPLISVVETARLLGISTYAAYELREQGKLRSSYIGKRRVIPRADVERCAREVLSGPESEEARA